jgi:hypothetical protein
MIDSGNASICPKGKYLLIDNLSNGFDLYNIPRTSPTHSLIIPTKRLYTKQGVFTKNGAQIACGSDHGKVYLYDTQLAAHLQVLRHTTGTDIACPKTSSLTASRGYHDPVRGGCHVFRKPNNSNSDMSNNSNSDICIWAKPVSHLSLMRNTYPR